MRANTTNEIRAKIAFRLMLLAAWIAPLPLKRQINRYAVKAVGYWPPLAHLDR